MITIYIAQTYRLSRLRDGVYVPAHGEQFGTLGEAIQLGRAAVALGHRADIMRVSGCTTTNIWDEPVLLKRLLPSEEQPAGCDERQAPNPTIERALEIRRRNNPRHTEASNDNERAENHARIKRPHPPPTHQCGDPY